MADKTIWDYPTLATADPNDLILMASDEETYNMKVETLKNAMGEAASKPPVVRNGYWYVWSAANNDYVNTGTAATGPKGDKGDKGDTGDVTPDAQQAATNAANSASSALASQQAAAQSAQEAQTAVSTLPALAVNCGTISSLPKSVSSSAITSDMIVVAAQFGTPSAVTWPWRFNTDTTGQITISVESNAPSSNTGISGSTTLTLYLQKTR